IRKPVLTPYRIEEAHVPNHPPCEGRYSSVGERCKRDRRRPPSRSCDDTPAATASATMESFSREMAAPRPGSALRLILRPIATDPAGVPAATRTRFFAL